MIEAAAWPIGVYIVAAIVLAVVEGYAIGDDEPGNTISESIWSLRASPLVWAVIPLIVWAAAHFVLPWEPDGVAVNDVGYIAVGFALALWNVIYRRRRHAEKGPQ